ncbi:MAG: PAS domain-containing sensor histidine kinase, partial [Gammaproteobacteria bacterium]
GLGLAIAFGIIERHGGEIEVHSRLDEGTSIRAHLPVDPGRENAATR